MIDLQLLKILFCLPFLVYGCYSDIKTRTVQNKVWKVMLLFIVPITVFEIFNQDLSYLINLSVSILITFLVVYTLFHFKAFEGADAKLLLMLAIMFPVYPSFSMIQTNSIFALSVLGNALIVGSALFLILLLRKLLTKKHMPKDIPFFVPITIGFIISAVVGDILYIWLHPVYCMI